MCWIRKASLTSWAESFSDLSEWLTAMSDLNNWEFVLFDTCNAVDLWFACDMVSDLNKWEFLLLYSCTLVDWWFACDELKLTSQPGVEPRIFWSEVRRAVHCATGPPVPSFLWAVSGPWCTTNVARSKLGLGFISYIFIQVPASISDSMSLKLMIHLKFWFQIICKLWVIAQQIVTGDTLYWVHLSAKMLIRQRLKINAVKNPFIYSWTKRVSEINEWLIGTFILIHVIRWGFLVFASFSAIHCWFVQDWLNMTRQPESNFKSTYR